MNASETVDTVGLSTLSRRSIKPAARPTATASIATVDELERPYQCRLRLDGDHARPKSAEGADAIADMGADVEDEIARPDECAVEAVHGSAPPRIAVIDPQRPHDAADGAQGMAQHRLPGAL
jgi:hypothetical protein